MRKLLAKPPARPSQVRVRNTFRHPQSRTQRNSSTPKGTAFVSPPQANTKGSCLAGLCSQLCGEPHPHAEGFWISGARNSRCADRFGNFSLRKPETEHAVCKRRRRPERHHYLFAQSVICGTPCHRISLYRAKSPSRDTSTS